MQTHARGYDKALEINRWTKTLTHRQGDKIHRQHTHTHTHTHIYIYIYIYIEGSFLLAE